MAGEKQPYQNIGSIIAHSAKTMEVIGATNAGTFMTFAESGVVEGKEWLSSRDANVRPSHQTADGQRVGLNETFDVGGTALMYPGDPAGPPGEVINCRCTVLPVLKEGL